MLTNDIVSFEQLGPGSLNDTAMYESMLEIKCMRGKVIVDVIVIQRGTLMLELT